jgi:hypothetical protein
MATTSMTPAQRRQRAQIAALERASKPEYDGKTATASAREAAWEKWCRQVDPDGVLDAGGAPQAGTAREAGGYEARAARPLSKQEGRQGVTQSLASDWADRMAHECAGLLVLAVERVGNTPRYRIVLWSEPEGKRYHIHTLSEATEFIAKWQVRKTLMASMP